MEFLILCWSTERHTFITAWGEFGPTLEDVAALTCMPMFDKSHAKNIILDEKAKKKLEFLSKAYSGSKITSKSTYASLLKYFEIGKGKNS